MMNVRLGEKSNSTREQPHGGNKKRRTGNPSTAENEPNKMATNQKR